MKTIKYIACIITGLALGYMLCYFVLQDKLIDLEVLKDTSIYLDEEQQVSRTKEGKKLHPLKYENNLYIPLTEIGYMLNDKDIEVKQNRIDLKTVKIPTNIGKFETETLDDKSFTEMNIADNNYTVVLNWSTWCPYCIEDLSEIEKVHKDYKKDGIQVIGLLVNEDYETAKQLVNSKNITFEVLKTNNTLRDKLQTNMVGIPEFVVLDKEGEIVTDNINGGHNILLLKNKLDELITEDCSKCGES